jgi:hypothetical protein
MNSKNLHNETISRNNLKEISRNIAKFRERKYNEISRNFAKLKSLSWLFRISRNKKILFRDHPRSYWPFTLEVQIIAHSILYKNDKILR